MASGVREISGDYWKVLERRINWETKNEGDK
jgi:hypothetical protein